LKMAMAALVVVPDMAVVTLGYLAWVVRDCVGLRGTGACLGCPVSRLQPGEVGLVAFDVAGLGCRSQRGVEWNSLALA